MGELKSKYEILIESLAKEGRVSKIEDSKKNEIVSAVEKELDEFRFHNQKRIKESQEQISSVVLTA